MEGEPISMSENLDKLQAALEELFHSERQDLDFGVYRIINAKRTAIDRFIIESLPKKLMEETLTLSAQNERELLAAEENARREVVDTLGASALDAGGNLLSQYISTPVGQAYMIAKAAYNDRNLASTDLSASVCNHLLVFFNRYHSDGDFIARRRYSENARYIIPFNGEETHYYWATNDQYYVKTHEYFRNYSWTTPEGIAVHFKIGEAEDECQPTAEHRYLKPCLDIITWDQNDRILTVPFGFHPIKKMPSGKKQQTEIRKALFDDVIAGISETVKALNGPTLEISRASDRADDHSTLLSDHLQQYTRRNLADFFVHKNLGPFLRSELDFYIKNEVLEMAPLDPLTVDDLQRRLTQAQLVSSIGGQIIDFLHQVEEVQKSLWEKKKFITECQYCIAIGEIAEEFYPVILENSAQWAEWQALFSDLTDERSIAVLNQHPNLPVDTRHFDPDWVDKLLGSFPDLDDLVDGLLVHSENWQALNLLSDLYRGQVQCVYIDPPFNTLRDDFIYKDGLPHATWLTMMDDRVSIAVELLALSGTFYAHIDYTEKERLKLLLDRHLTYITEIIWRIGWISGYKSKAKKFIRNHDTIYQYGRSASPLFNKKYIDYPDDYERRDDTKAKRDGYPLEDTWNCSDKDRLNSIQILSYSGEKVGDQSLTQKNEALVARMIEASTLPKQVVLDYFLGSGTSTAVAHKLGRQYIGIEIGEHFDSVIMPRMKNVIYGTSIGISDSVGWTGGGAFKYIRLESYEDCLDNVNFANSDGPTDVEDAIIDYQLKYDFAWESRDNPSLLDVRLLNRPFDYVLGSVVGMNDRELTADIPETFAFLLGLAIRQRRVEDDGDRRYLVYEGQIRGATARAVAVIWRDTDGWNLDDYERDARFIAEMHIAESVETLYINGDAAVPGAVSIEPVFKARLSTAGT